MIDFDRRMSFMLVLEGDLSVVRACYIEHIRHVT